MSALMSGILIVFSQSAPALPPASPEDPPKVTMTVRPCTESVSHGQWLILACTFTIPEGWHIYWKNPGASGVPTTIDVKTPIGFQVQPTIYPRPSVFQDSGGVTYGYENEITMLQPILPPVSWPVDGAELAFEVTGTWLVCREKCFIGSEETTSHVSWSSRPREPEPWAKAVLNNPRLPRPLNMRPQTTAEIRGNRLVIQGPVSKSNAIGFLPDPTPGVSMEPPVIETTEDALIVEIPFTVRSGDTLGQKPFARGLLTFGEKATMSAYEVSIPIERTPKESKSKREQREQQP